MVGITQSGLVDAAEHKSCVKSTAHNLILSQLYNNVSAIYVKEKAYEGSAHYANKALQWNKHYEKHNTQ